MPAIQCTGYGRIWLLSPSEVDPLKRSFARALLKALGWKIEGGKPVHQKYVLIAAPHTSNWDFPMMILFAWAFDIRISWMGKASLFRRPFGWIMRRIGGIPVDRVQAGNLVAAMTEEFANRDALVLVVPAEGSRARVEYWKSGFYRIARGAGVPVIPSYLDYGQQRGGFGPALVPGNSLSDDLQVLREFYAPMSGLYPDQFGPLRLREENESSPTDSNP